MIGRASANDMNCVRGGAGACEIGARCGVASRQPDASTSKKMKKIFASSASSA